MSLLEEAKDFGELWASWIGAGLKPVSKFQAQERANVCLKCPKNQPHKFQEFYKGAVAFLLRRQVAMKNKMNLRLDGEKSLHICDACGCLNVLKPWVPIEHVLKTTKMDDLDPNCWILKEKNESKKVL